MKLVGSRTEEEIRRQLVESHRSLFHDPGRRQLLDALRSVVPGLKTAYVLGWTPEQGEDIFRVLVNSEILVGVEIDRANPTASPRVSRLHLDEYRKGLGRPGRIKLAVAQHLAKSDMG